VTLVEKNFLEYLFNLYEINGGENIHEFLGIPLEEYIRWMGNPEYNIMCHVNKKWGDYASQVG